MYDDIKKLFPEEVKINKWVEKVGESERDISLDLLLTKNPVCNIKLQELLTEEGFYIEYKDEAKLRSQEIYEGRSYKEMGLTSYRIIITNNSLRLMAHGQKKNKGPDVLLEISSKFVKSLYK
ncbi:hypothetical protein JW949_03580 [Candidatus Woesearchaeota archaeon]|nr:hypothetical protein [Candidatus Woesearchaeota archaeon]